MARRDIAVIGGSAGAIESASDIARTLPADFPAAIFVVVHFPGSAPSALPRILSRAGPLPARHPANETALEAGQIYVAPPDRHLFIEAGIVRLSRGPKENGHRPAIDPLFRSAAHHHGERVIGVLLSGNLSDGTAGLLSIKQHGGIAIVQDPDTALYAGMPRSAIERVPVHFVVPVHAVSELLMKLTADPAPSRKDMAMDLPGQDGTIDEAGLEDRKTQAGVPSTMSCPECHGVLWEHREGDVLVFRCRVGHAFTEEALLAIQAEQMEAALWTALRALEEHAALSRRLAVPRRAPRTLPQCLHLHRARHGRRAPRLDHPHRVGGWGPRPPGRLDARSPAPPCLDPRPAWPAPSSSWTRSPRDVIRSAHPPDPVQVPPTEASPAASRLLSSER